MEQIPHSTLDKPLIDFVQATSQKLGIPGVAVGVWADGREIYACHGVTSIDNPLPVDQDTLFVLGSVTKTYTATALMRLVVSVEVAGYLDDLRKPGVSESTIQLGRDLWILVQAISGKDAATLIDDKREAIQDPEFISIYLEIDAAFDWSPGDPRLNGLADRWKRWFAKRQRKTYGRKIPILDPTIRFILSLSNAVIRQEILACQS